MKITEPGNYYNVKESDYHSDPLPDPSLSAGIIKPLLNLSPLHASRMHPRLNPNYKEENKTQFDIGKAAHSLLLNDPRAFEIIDADDWRKKDTQAARDAAYAAGKTPLLRKHWDSVQAMVKATRAALQDHECSNAFTASSKSEVTLVWRETNGVWCRCRIDSMAENGKDFYDYETTAMSANPDTISNMVNSMGWDIVSAFYKRGIKKVLGVENPNYRFVVQEASDPNALSVIALNSSAEFIANKKIEAAISLWGECLVSGKWPSYPNRVCYVGIPAYAESQWLEREIRESEEEEL